MIYRYGTRVVFCITLSTLADVLTVRLIRLRHLEPFLIDPMNANKRFLKLQRNCYHIAAFRREYNLGQPNAMSDARGLVLASGGQSLLFGGSALAHKRNREISRM
jgi:hypothetical protein